VFSNRYLIALGIPGLVWFAVFVLAALYALIAIAAGGVDPILLSPVPAWNPLDWSSASLHEVGSSLLPPNGYNWAVFERTCVYVGIAVAGCIAIGYPVAYFAAIHARRSKGLILALLVLPFLVSYMLRMLAWVGLLVPEGWVNTVLLNLHMIDHPVNWLSGRPSTVVFALIYGWVPYFIIPLYASLARFDRAYLEAANDLGAGPFQTFVRVTLPLSRQGVLAGVVIVALPMFGDYFTNALVSGATSTSMVGTLINTYSQSQTQQGVSAAMAVWLMVFLGALLLPYVRSSSRAIRDVTL
jgi:ABC-type spermidine/putrescine transport system permease subunit I